LANAVGLFLAPALMACGTQQQEMFEKQRYIFTSLA
jgi:hypothetical protein